MKMRRITAILLAICAAALVGCTAEPDSVAEPSELPPRGYIVEYTKDYPPKVTFVPPSTTTSSTPTPVPKLTPTPEPSPFKSRGWSVTAPNGEDISARVARLWRMANRLHNMDKTTMSNDKYDYLSIGAVEDGYAAINGFDDWADEYLTQEGKSELFAAEAVIGLPAFEKREDGVYGYAQTNDISEEIHGCEVIESDENSMRLSIEYAAYWIIDNEQAYRNAEMTIAKSDNKWKIASYDFPGYIRSYYDVFWYEDLHHSQ